MSDSPLDVLQSFLKFFLRTTDTGREILCNFSCDEPGIISHEVDGQIVNKIVGASEYGSSVA